MEKKEKNYKLYQKQKETLYQVQNDLNLGICTLYNYATKRRKIENMQIKMLLMLAKYFGMEPMELYEEMRKYLD